MQKKTICVIGHEKIPTDKLDYVRRELEREIKSALKNGYRIFLTSFTSEVDVLFVQIVDRQRDNHSDFFLEADIPYPNSIKKLKKDERKIFAKCNGMKAITNRKKRDSLMLCNRHMVQQSNRVIVVSNGFTESNTCFAMDYARAMERDLRIISI